MARSPHDRYPGVTHNGRTKLAGVMGWPVGHSRSPRLHGYWLAHYGIEGAYVPLPVAPGHLEDALRALPLLGFAGVNLTIPHKEAALPILDHVTPLARRIGAVNLVTVTSDGHLGGDSSDGYGFIENLKQGAPGWLAGAGPAAVLGAGGAARAVVAALLDEGVPEIRLVNRSAGRAELLAASLRGPIRPMGWSEREAALADAALLVNTTSLGMSGEPPLPLALERLPPAAVVTDIVYAPLETSLLAAARARGHRTVDGLGMLLHQARPAFEAWFGVAPEVTAELRRFMLQGL
jgi:shikimate dehydrogenase